MIPIKGKKYMINCQGPFDYNRYMGEGICTGGICPGGVDGYDSEEVVYGFRIPDYDCVVFFLEQEIVGEFDNGLIKEPEEIQDQIDSENNYCEKCGSCGETGCCPPINCHAVKCKYGEINIKDYRCFQDQWSVMYEALKDIVAESCEENVSRIASNALNVVDKLWDKLYSGE